MAAANVLIGYRFMSLAVGAVVFLFQQSASCINSWLACFCIPPLPPLAFWYWIQIYPLWDGWTVRNCTFYLSWYTFHILWMRFINIFEIQPTSDSNSREHPSPEVEWTPTSPISFTSSYHTLLRTLLFFGIPHPPRPHYIIGHEFAPTTINHSANCRVWGWNETCMDTMRIAIGR